jgi:ParB-like chromosome segregation protein Spo0J
VLRRFEPDAVTSVSLGAFGEYLRRYRVRSPEAIERMRESLERYGQISPLVAFERQGKLEVIDGFKRLEAAQSLLKLSKLSVRLVEVDEHSAKAAVYLLNRVGGRTRDLEEAWIVHSLVREDGLSQQEVADLLGRHKSWVSRRLALIERLCPEAREDLQLGFLSPTAAREIHRLPCGNQADLLQVVRRESLSTSETRALVDVFLGCATGEQQEFVLTHPREALAQERGSSEQANDPRLSAAGNRLSKRLALLLELLPRLEGWLRSRGRAELMAGDFPILEPSFEQLKLEARSVAEAIEDFLGV